jgi:ribosomal-protein-alanine acetyltransferase
VKVDQTHAQTDKKIRTFEKCDELALVEIAAESPESAQWSRGSYLEFAGSNRGLILVAEAAEKIRGFLACRCIAEEAEILNLAVRRDQRRCGVATALLKAAVEEFYSRSASRVFLEVRESNAAAMAFYEKHGFEKTGKRPGYYRDPQDSAILMEMKLTRKHQTARGDTSKEA